MGGCTSTKAGLAQNRVGSPNNSNHTGLYDNKFSPNQAQSTGAHTQYAPVPGAAASLNGTSHSVPLEGQQVGESPPLPNKPVGGEHGTVRLEVDTTQTSAPAVATKTTTPSGMANPSTPTKEAASCSTPKTSDSKSSARRRQLGPMTILRSGEVIEDSKNGNTYTIEKTLGKGSYSRVYLASGNNSKKVAVKVVQKLRLKASELASMHRETSILASIDHPHVIKYVEHFENSEYLFIVTEYMPGGELFERVVEREFYNEKDVRTVMTILLQTIKYCHDRGIVHRDIKPENILLASKMDDSSIKLADFGFAKKVDFNKFTKLQTACGTPGYVAPEILTNETYDKRVDVWSLGVVAYILLCGYPPFRKGDRKQLFKQIKAAKYEFDSPWWDPVSDQAKDFVSKMLQADPTQRATIAELLVHEFLAGNTDRDLKSVLGPLKDWNAKRKIGLLRNAWNAVKAFEHSIRKVEGSGASLDGSDEMHSLPGNDDSGSINTSCNSDLKCCDDNNECDGVSRGDESLNEKALDPVDEQQDIQAKPRLEGEGNSVGKSDIDAKANNETNFANSELGKSLQDEAESPGTVVDSESEMETEGTSGKFDSSGTSEIFQDAGSTSQHEAAPPLPPILPTKTIQAEDGQDVPLLGSGAGTVSTATINVSDTELK